jgi:hypothetical protein
LEFNENRYDSGVFAEFGPFLAVFTACLTRGCGSKRDERYDSTGLLSDK